MSASSVSRRRDPGRGRGGGGGGGGGSNSHLLPATSIVHATTSALLSSPASPSLSDRAILVTGPRCSEHYNVDGSVVQVESDHCEDVDVSDRIMSGGGPGLRPWLESAWRFIDTSTTPAVGNNGNGNSYSQYGNNNKDRLATELQDMSPFVGALDRTVTNRMLPSTQDGLAGYDTCREYSYEEEDEYIIDSKKLAPSPAAAALSSMTSSTATVLSHDAAHIIDNTRIYVVGRVYRPAQQAARREDEASLFWFTYRCDFPEMKPYGLSSDSGWGCMLRSAQMLLAQALRLHYRSREWRPPAHNLTSQRRDPFVRSILTWFADFPSTTDCFYSIHNMTACGLLYDKLPGEWYGPGTACYVLRDLVQMHERYHMSNSSTSSNNNTSSSSINRTIADSSESKLFRVHVAMQGTVYRDEIENLMTKTSKERMEEEKHKRLMKDPPAHPLDATWEDELVEALPAGWDASLLLLIPLRLGLGSFNPDYVQAVAHTFSLPQSVGVLGGRPRGARWFYGAVSDGSKILGLDPHTVQNAPRRRRLTGLVLDGKTTSAAGPVDLSEEYVRSVHTTYPEVFSLLKMDPSIALGFYCKTKADLDSVVANLQGWRRAHPGSPELFHVADASPDYASNVSTAMNDMMLSADGSALNSSDEHQTSEEDEYVML